MHADNLEKFVQSICRPGANYQQALLFFKLLQQATSDVSEPTQHENAIVSDIYRSYYLGMSNCWKLSINIASYTRSYSREGSKYMRLTPPFAILKRRIRKLGAYYWTTRRICAICATPAVNKYMENLNFQEVSEPY